MTWRRILSEKAKTARKQTSAIEKIAKRKDFTGIGLKKKLEPRNLI